MISKMNCLMDGLVKEFDDRHFFTIDDLYTFGLFGTKYAARKALNSGQISFVQISKRRRIIPRPALLDYLRNNLSTNFYDKEKL